MLEISRPVIDSRETIALIASSELPPLLDLHQQISNERNPYEILEWMIQGRSVLSAIPYANVPPLKRLMNPHTKKSALGQIDFIEAMLHEKLADISLRLHVFRKTDGEYMVFPQNATNQLTRRLDYLIYEKTGSEDDLKKADGSRRWTPDGILVNVSKTQIRKVCEHTRSESRSYVYTKVNKALTASREYPGLFEVPGSCLFSVHEKNTLPVSEEDRYEMKYDAHTLRTSLLRRVINFYRNEGLCDTRYANPHYRARTSSRASAPHFQSR